MKTKTASQNDDLLASARKMLRIIKGIRYCEWPTIGLGIDLNPDVLDDVIGTADSAIRKSGAAKAQSAYRRQIEENIYLEQQNGELLAQLRSEWNYAYSQIEAACGGELAQKVKRLVMARRERIRAEKQAILAGNPRSLSPGSERISG